MFIVQCTFPWIKDGRLLLSLAEGGHFTDFYQTFAAHLPRQAVFGLSPTAGFLPTTLHSSCLEEKPIPMAVVTSELPC